MNKEQIIPLEKIGRMTVRKKWLLRVFLTATARNSTAYRLNLEYPESSNQDEDATSKKSSSETHDE